MGLIFNGYGIYLFICLLTYLFIAKYVQSEGRFYSSVSFEMAAVSLDAQLDSFDHRK